MKQSDIAKGLGLSKGTVSKLVARGMPLDSVDAARNWRAAHSREGLGHKSHSSALDASARALAEPLPPTTALVAAPDDPAGTLTRMRDIEQRAYAQINAALEKARKSESAEDYSALNVLIRSYNQAAANSLAAAASWEKHCRAAGDVAPIEHLTNVLLTTLEPLMAQLDNLASRIAPSANPAAPAIAEAAIADAVKAIRTQIATALASPVPPAPAFA